MREVKEGQSEGGKGIKGDLEEEVAREMEVSQGSSIPDKCSAVDRLKAVPAQVQSFQLWQISKGSLFAACTKYKKHQINK